MRSLCDVQIFPDFRLPKVFNFYAAEVGGFCRDGASFLILCFFDRKLTARIVDINMIVLDAVSSRGDGPE